MICCCISILKTYILMYSSYMDQSKQMMFDKRNILRAYSGRLQPGFCVCYQKSLKHMGPWAFCACMYLKYLKVLPMQSEFRPKVTMLRRKFHARGAIRNDAPWWRRHVRRREKRYIYDQLYIVIIFTSGWQEW